MPMAQPNSALQWTGPAVRVIMVVSQPGRPGH
jgi:hypothetical protein